MMWDIALTKTLRHARRHFNVAVNFHSDAQRLVLFGPSGAGKTLTLKMLAGLLQPDHGHVRIMGETLFESAPSPGFARPPEGAEARGSQAACAAWDGLKSRCLWLRHDQENLGAARRFLGSVGRVNQSPQSRRLAYVFQDYALFPHLTVRQNIAFALRTGWRNPSRIAASDAVDRWLEAFALQSLETHYPHQLSGGQKQRTALARALVVQPRALLLDEPFAALDKALRQQLRSQLAQLLAEIRVPMLLITHDEDDLAALADEVVFIAGGRVVSRAEAQGSLVE